jgi:hypothetical protein
VRGETPSTAPARSQPVHWIIAVSLAIIAICLVLRLDSGPWLPEAYAQRQKVGAAGVFAFTGQLGPRTYGLFMVDVDAGNVWCYEYSRERGKLRLVAARSFLYDRQLEEFNVEAPTPGDVAELVERLQSRRANSGESVKTSQDK